MAEKVIWSATAREDLRNIATYIAEDRPSLAEGYCLRLIEFAETAGDFPRLGRVVPELEDENVREIVRRPYRIIYENFLTQPRPVIMRVWHGARGRPEITRPTLP
jgi:plasmid stabilization system protein ParE